MKRAFAFVLLTCSIFALGQAQSISNGATVYIEPMNENEIYLAAAMTKENVALVVVSDKEKANFIIKFNVKQIVYDGWSATSATITMTDLRTSQIVFTGSASTNRLGIKGVAEKCAEQLKDFMKGRKSHRLPWPK